MRKMFRPHSEQRDERSRAIYAAYEIAYTAVDFGAALAFVAGSILFFYEDLQTAGTWLFLIGSVLFALKPTLRLAREIHYAASGDLKPLAKGEK